MFSNYIKRFVVAMIIVNAWCVCGVNIFQATKNGDVEQVARIVNKNPQAVNAKHARRQKITPLHVAAEHGYVPVARLLLSHGADVNAKTAILRDPPLYKAVVLNHLPMVRLLIEYGADIDDKSECWHGAPPAHLAAHHGYMDILRFLVQQGAKIHARYAGDPTALYVAACSGQYDAVVFLVQQGVEINDNLNASAALSSPPDTPLSKAIEGGHSKIAQFLIRHKANLQDYEAKEIATKWPYYDWRADKAKFIKARTDHIMDQFGLPKDIAKLILEIEGIVPLRASESEC